MQSAQIGELPSPRYRDCNYSTVDLRLSRESIVGERSVSGDGLSHLNGDGAGTCANYGVGMQVCIARRCVVSEFEQTIIPSGIDSIEKLSHARYAPALQLRGNIEC